MGRSSRVCDNDIKTFSHLISAQLHKFRSKKSGRVWCTCDWSEGFSATGLFTCHPKVFLCGTKDFTRKEGHSPQTQCSLKTWTKPASAYVAIKWVEQSSSSCQKSYHSGSLGSRASHETTLHPTWNKTVDSCSSNQANKHFVPLLSFSSFHLMWLIVRWPVQLF